MNFSNILLQWYKKNHRDLPWRNTRNPYLIWISEIILQQTRVNQGYQYYLRFVERFPDIKTLADATEEEVLKLWQGLGYYSRARNIYHAARQIINDFDGIFPSEYHDIIKLKGIGSYSASAIASIAFKQPYPVIDGNVMRVISRIYSITTDVDSNKGKNEIHNILKLLIDPQHPDIFNQAIMELGAMVCLPQNPLCLSCPLQALCFAFENKNTAAYPVKSKKIIQRSRYFYYLVIHLTKDNGKFIYLNKRSNNDIWKNMYDFPLIESDIAINSNDDLLARISEITEDENYILAGMSKNYKHQLSHQTIFASFIDIECKQALPPHKDYIKVPYHEIHNFPLPKLIDIYIKDRQL